MSGENKTGTNGGPSPNTKEEKNQLGSLVGGTSTTTDGKVMTTTTTTESAGDDVVGEGGLVTNDKEEQALVTGSGQHHNNRRKRLSGMKGMTEAKVHQREKMVSDLTGLSVDQVRARISRGDRRTVSGLIMLLNVPDNAIPTARTAGAGAGAGGDEEAAVDDKGRPVTRVPRAKQRSRQNSGVALRGNYLIENHDLHMAEEVQAHGTAQDRKELGITETQHNAKIEATGGADDGFVFNHEGLTTEEATALIEKYGKNQLPEKVVPKWLIFLRLMYAPMPIMIWLAIIVEAGIQQWLDMGILLAIQFINAFISFYETTKAGDAVAALKSSLKPVATCKRNGKWDTMDGSLLVPGDLVLLGSGSAIPADCRVNGGEIDVDQAALTGESLPVTFYKGDSCKMGSTVVRGEVEATVEHTGGETFLGKTASLLQETGEHSHLQKVLMSIMFVLVGLSLLLCLISFIYLLLSDLPFKEALSHTIVLLVASIPLAIEIVTTTTLAIGSKNLVKHGAIVSNLSAIEDLAGMSILCSDKTGTLTLNKMVLQDDTPIYAKGQDQESILVMAALAAKWKEPPRDALDRLTLGAVNMSLLEKYEQLEFVPFDPTTKRTEGTLRDTTTGVQFKTSKGAPHIILKLLNNGDADSPVREAVEVDVARLGAKGIRSLAVAKCDAAGQWTMQGLLTFLDPPRPDTKKTIEDAREYGVEVKMITGDHLLIAVNTALQLNMGDRIFSAEPLPMLDPVTKAKPPDLSKNYGPLCLAANGFAQVFPEHKYLIVECLREMGYTTGMTGDGVNDAPALKRADIGIAVAGATDAARAAADIVLTEEGLGTIIHGIVIAREIFSRIANFITYRIAATLQLLLFFFIAVFAFHPDSYDQGVGAGGGGDRRFLEGDEEDGESWPRFFHMPVLMLMLITLLNDGTLITIAYDYAEAAQQPCKWNLMALFLTSSILGLVSCLSSLILLHFLLDSWNEDGLFMKLGMQGVPYGRVITAIYLKVSVSDFLTLFSARTGPLFFWKVTPAPILVAGGVLALTLSSLLAVFWPKGTLDEIAVAGLRDDMGLFGFVWIYSLFFWGVQDVLKVVVSRCMYATNFNNIRSTGIVIMPEAALKIIAEFDVAMTDTHQKH